MNIRNFNLRMKMTLFFLYSIMVVIVAGEHPHGHVGPPPPISEFKYKNITEFENAFKHWIYAKTDVFSVTDLIDVMLSRLGVDNITCDPNERPTIEALRNASMSYSLGDLVTNETLICDLFHKFVAFAAHTSRNSKQNCCTMQGDCLTKLTEDLNKMSPHHLYGAIEARYNRLGTPLHFNGSKRVAHDLETFTNRFMCVDENSLMRTVFIDHGDRVDEHAKYNVHLSALILYILQGYTLLSKNEVCPGAYLNRIYTHYGLKDNLQQSSNGLASLIRDLKYDSLKENHQHDPNPHIPPPSNLHFMSKRHDRTISSDVIKSFQLFDYPPPDIGHINRNHYPHDMPPPGLKPEFLKYDWNYKPGSDSRQCHDQHFLLQVFNDGVDPTLSGEDNIPMSLFLDMCPALLYTSLFKPCRHHGHNAHRQHTTMMTTSDLTTAFPTTDSVSNETSILYYTSHNSTSPRYKSYLYGSLSVFVISLCSIVGAAFMKLSRADIKIYMMGSMLALAVGCLVADAGLHLLPEIVRNEDNDDAEGDELVPGYLRKMCAFLASIYAFFVLELLLSTRHTHSHSHTVAVENEHIETISLKIWKDVDANLETNLNLNNIPTKNRIPKTMNISHENNTNSTNATPPNNEQHTDNSIQVLEAGLSNTIHVPSVLDSSKSRLESRCSNTSDRISIHDAKSGVKALAWMIIIGDGIHNFADGLAIGAAFALTFTKGISTSITVLCHELPHELGDFAVLVSTGMSVKRAMFLNFVSSLTAFAGLYLGLSLGEQAEASQWIFAVGAGMFLYVALTDLVPECKEYFKTKCTVLMFVGQNIGLLIGYVTMLLLAMYEDKLEIKE